MMGLGPINRYCHLAKDTLMRRILAITTIASAAFLSNVSVAQDKTEDVQVMVVGVYHFANPGLDEHNIDVDSVLTPRRQAELDDLAQALAAFRPTRVMVEVDAPGPDYRIAEYDSFSTAMLAEDPNEITQIGYRLADRSGLDSVEGIDVRSKIGEEDYFPIDQVRSAAQRSGQASILDDLDRDVGGWVENFTSSQSHRSIPDMLIEVNSAGYPGDQRFYDRLLPVAVGDEMAGAYLNGRWYTRNAMIFAKLMRVAKPGDRIAVVFGAGHIPWLRHFAGTVAGYSFVDPKPYLELARNLSARSADSTDASVNCGELMGDQRNCADNR